MAAKKKRVGQPVKTKAVKAAPTRKASKKAAAPRTARAPRTPGEVVEKAKKAVKKAVKVAKVKIVAAERAIEERITAAVSRAKRKKPAGPAR